ncbi:hypothetical protein VCRA2117O328_10249 [Vibrio crassostreae]|nr:hypothetical protein VCRA2117O328_10249 [Vibrio crassostreae]
MKELVEKKYDFCEVKIAGNNIQIIVDEGKKQLKHYWIAKIEKDAFGEADIKGFASKKTNEKTISFLNIEDGEYLIQLGKDNKDMTRTQFSVKDGEITND